VEPLASAPGCFNERVELTLFLNLIFYVFYGLHQTQGMGVMTFSTSYDECITKI